ncbi:MAG: hypothetical protein U0Q21_11705 [Dermatophilaceae bacterium]
MTTTSNPVGDPSPQARHHEPTTQAPAHWRRTFVWLTLAGAAGFWLANLAISSTSIAADYRSAAFAAATDRPRRYLLIGTMLNAVRSTALGVAVGYGAERQLRGKGQGSSGAHSAPHNTERPDTS